MSLSPTCTDCHIKAPDTSTNYTLISASFGWRLTSTRLKNGVRVSEWRCPDCWRKHKTVEAPPGVRGRRSSQPPGAR